MLLRAKRERVHVDAGVRSTGVELVRLDEVEVGALTLREAVLAVELQLGGDNRVLAPAVHVKRGLGKHEGASIRERRTGGIGVGKISSRVVSLTRGRNIVSNSIIEETRSVNERTRGKRGLTTKRVNGIRESINGVSVVERLSTEDIRENRVILKRLAVVDVRVRLGNEDELLARVVEVELDLVRRRTNRLIASELELLDQVLVRVLGHAAALVGVKEHVVDVERRGNKRLW